jgi:hypothetical protein
MFQQITKLRNNHLYTHRNAFNKIEQHSQFKIQNTGDRWKLFFPLGNQGQNSGPYAC